MNLIRKKTMLLCFFIANVFLFSGCGVKDLPVPPRARAPVAVADLSYEIDQERVVLTWTISPTHRKGRSAIEMFSLYRARTPLSEPPCAKCPKLFKRIADLAIEDVAGTDLSSDKAIYTDALQRGYRYTYKINAIGENGMVSYDSNAVEFEY